MPAYVLRRERCSPRIWRRSVRARSRCAPRRARRTARAIPTPASFSRCSKIAAEGVEAAAVEVWRSGNTDSVRAYRVSRGLDPAGGAPAVIVQRLVKARAAGVAFSADPVSGRRDRIVISAVAGLGDRLVGGEADGDDYVIDRASGPCSRRLPTACSRRRSRGARGAGRQGRAGARRSPQDIEWAFEGERLFLLQARPITTALRAAAIADATLTIFDNSNIVESYPGLVSPLTYSFAQYVYARVYRTFVALLGVSDDDHPRARRGVREHARPRRRPRLLQSGQLVPRAGAAARLCHQSRLHGNHDGRGRAAAGR